MGIVLALVGIGCVYGVLGVYHLRKHEIATACIDWFQALLVGCGIIMYLGGPGRVSLAVAGAAGFIGSVMLFKYWLVNRKS